MLGLARRNTETAMPRPQPTEVGRWDPWSMFNQLQAEMERSFNSLFGPTPRWTEEFGAFTPAVDLYETGEELVLNAHLPGISREDVQVEILGDTIHITGETKRPVPEKDVTVHQAQSRYGKFDLRYTLPVEVKAEQVKAIYRNGVLEIRLPKVEAAKPKPVPVTIEG
jgi:HSP20 family protein